MTFLGSALIYAFIVSILIVILGMFFEDWNREEFKRYLINPYMPGIVLSVGVSFAFYYSEHEPVLGKSLGAMFILKGCLLLATTWPTFVNFYKDRRPPANDFLIDFFNPSKKESFAWFCVGWFLIIVACQ